MMECEHESSSMESTPTHGVWLITCHSCSETWELVE